MKIERWSESLGLKLLGILLLFACYLAILLGNEHELERRSLQLHRDAGPDDRVLVAIRAEKPVDLSAGEIRIVLRFRPMGKLAKDEITPAVNLKLLLNTRSGPQEFDFPAGKRINPIDTLFSLEGNPNKYPFDRYQTYISLLMTMPSPTRHPLPPALPPAGEAAPKIGELIVGTTALRESEPVPISVDFSASVPGIKFAGDISSSPGVTGIDLKLQRARNVIAVSILVMAMMMCLAISVLAMALHAMKAGETSLLSPLSVAVALIFGLPALRNAQPGVPPLGVFGDYVSFLWAELIVAASAVLTIWRWLLSSPRPKTRP